MCQPAADCKTNCKQRAFIFIERSHRDKLLAVLLAWSALQCSKCKLSPSFVIVMIWTKIPGALFREFNEQRLIFTCVYVYVCAPTRLCVHALRSLPTCQAQLWGGAGRQECYSTYVYLKVSPHSDFILILHWNQKECGEMNIYIVWWFTTIQLDIPTTAVRVIYLSQTNKYILNLLIMSLEACADGLAFLQFCVTFS